MQLVWWKSYFEVVPNQLVEQPMDPEQDYSYVAAKVVYEIVAITSTSVSALYTALSLPDPKKDLGQRTCLRLLLISLCKYVK